MLHVSSILWPRRQATALPPPLRPRTLCQKHPGVGVSPIAKSNQEINQIKSVCYKEFEPKPRYLYRLRGYPGGGPGTYPIHSTRLNENTIAPGGHKSSPTSHLPEKLPQQHMKVMYPIFPLHRIAPAIVSRRMQALLHVAAQHDIFLLHFVAEGDGPLDALPIFRRLRVVEKPLENRQRLVLRQRHDHIRRNIVRINIQHQIRENPEIQGFLQSASRRVKSFAA